MSRRTRFAAAAALGAVLALLAACSPGPEQARACTEDGRTLDFGFYAFFAPISHSADEDPDSPGFHTHLGYEADLLTALEAMRGAGLTFRRKPIAPWDGIWLRSAQPEYDLVGGGITILDSRTFNAAGERVIAFTSGHVAFRQSLLVRAGDAGRLDGHDSLTSAVRVGVFVGTTGEARLLELTGLADAEGVLIAGTRVETPRGEVVADGGPGYAITAAGASEVLRSRSRLHPPSDDFPQVVFFGEGQGESELLASLADGSVDAVARGEVGNSDAAAASGGAFEVTALDPGAEYGGFTLAAADSALLGCIDEKIGYLTDGGRIGYAQWREDPSVFLRRARAWP